MDRLTVMADILGLADKSETFANFLTVCRKFGITCVYVFHTIYLSRQNWQMILSQTKIINIFPGSIQVSSIIGILTSYFSRFKHNYIPKRDIWINRLYFDISNSSNKQCLTIDTREINELGSAKFRTQADNYQEQVCYYNRNKKYINFNSFLAVTKQTSSTREIIFSIVNIIDKTKRNDNIYFEINDKLSDFKNDNSKCRGTVQRVGESDIIRTGGTGGRNNETDK